MERIPVVFSLLDAVLKETAVLLAEGEKLRDQAHMEAQKRNDCFEQSQNAYQSGDGGKAKELSNQGMKQVFSVCLVREGL